MLGVRMVTFVLCLVMKRCRKSAAVVAQELHAPGNAVMQQHD